MKHNILRGMFLDGGGSKKPEVSLQKWRPVVREVRYWNIYRSSGDIKSAGENHPDLVAIPLAGTSIHFMAKCHAGWGREVFSCLVPPNMHMNTHTCTLRHAVLFPASYRVGWYFQVFM